MLGLKLPTDPRWADLAAISVQAILTDHAYCEQKAAISMISLIQSYPEEWGHFRAVLAMLKKRGLLLGPQRRDDYVNKLKAFERHGGDRHSQLVEKLLIFALIEARSCERFRVLSVHLDDDELKEFYHGFMVSEAGHYRMFLDLAHLFGEKEVVKARWQEFLDYEETIMNDLAVRGDRIH